MDKDKLAKVIYTAYCDGVGGVAFNGDKLPIADQFFSDSNKEKQANAWRKASEAAEEFISENPL